MIQSRLPRWPDRDKVEPLENGLIPRQTITVEARTCGTLTIKREYLTADSHWHDHLAAQPESCLTIARLPWWRRVWRQIFG
jgi:hypothetical protein